MSNPKAKITKFGIQTGTTNTLYAVWEWDTKKHEHTKEYKYVWQYNAGNGWMSGSEGTTTNKNLTYSPPENAKSVRFKVKPISKTHDKSVNDKTQIAYWTADWTAYKTKKFYTPPVPSVPEVKIDKYKLTAKSTIYIDVIDVDTVEFEVVRDDKKSIGTFPAALKKNVASVSVDVEAGHEYKVRCRAVNAVRQSDYIGRGGPNWTIVEVRKVYKYYKSDWSEWCSGVQTIPSVPNPYFKVQANADKSVYVEWTKVSYAKNYTIQYTTEKRFFDSSPENVKSFGPVTTLHAEITGLELGKTYYFRICATNDAGSSGYSTSPYQSLILGKKPEAPTTWSSTTTAKVGEKINLYWVHNSQDNSHQRQYRLYLNVGGTVTEKVYNLMTPDTETEQTYSTTIDTSSYANGTTIKWCIATKGIYDEWSDYSITREIKVYAPPVLSMSTNLDAENLLKQFPLTLNLAAGPSTRTAIGYTVSVLSNEKYETTDETGELEIVANGDTVFNKTYDVMSNSHTANINASDIRLQNGVEYVIEVTMTNDVGMSVSSQTPFITAFEDDDFEVDAVSFYDEQTLSMSLMPFCVKYQEPEHEEEDPIATYPDNIVLSVYRREVDGTFVEIQSDIPNSEGTITIIDPHPALDYGRYRIIATSITTGQQVPRDIPVIPVDVKSIVIQWDGVYRNYVLQDEGESEEELQTSVTTLLLPYNIDISDNYSPDVSLVDYIGRESPVSYYGTQIGHTATWKVDIIKKDTETLNMLRKLARWRGDCYVREPSGSGYWAQVKVSFSQTHAQLVTPVSLSITRVEGGK